MLWQWVLLLSITVFMPYHLLSSANTTNTDALALAARAKGLSYLLPAVLPLYLAGRMSSTLRYYYRLTMYCTTLGLTSVWAVWLSVACNLIGKSASIQHYVARSFYYFASPLLGVKLKVEGEEYLNTDHSTVFVGNHQSMIDILYLGRIFPPRTSVMAKRELKWTPFLGQFMWLSNAVFVDRKNRQDAVKTFATAADTMKAKRMSIFIFAEGTRSNQAEPTMLPFKKGAFHLAVQGQFPIVPMVMENYHGIYAPEHKRFEGGEYTVRVLPPIPTVGFTSSSEDIATLSEKVRQAMVGALEDMHSKRKEQQEQQQRRLVDAGGKGQSNGNGKKALNYGTVKPSRRAVAAE